MEGDLQNSLIEVRPAGQLVCRLCLFEALKANCEIAVNAVNVFDALQMRAVIAPIVHILIRIIAAM